ncbi:NADH-quinone oxidoreductase subunit NuoE [Clostridium aciditolerans]|uniref:NADH-quinone oxidoreductase subunit NuoE n=1 Tax=Clostridium aciditolerans TaxID=339861 RepID=A0A934HWY8_9CLOT|nr:NADH-quinone oxidoreductase subunit NuoE [Clostridium aciditolerans]MBI6873544.1 NADH-quinone oxidoreductase subunit NuoE [Clostridium aciditolerans]
MACDCEKNLESKFSTNQVDLSLMDNVFDRYHKENGNLISILQDAQGVYGYLPLDVLKLIADKTGNKRAKVYGVATFYSQFRLNPVGKYIILQCQGTACHVNGSEAVGNAICDELGISPGETSSDGMFSLEDVACLGCCSLAPVIMINGEAYGNLTPDGARRIIKDIYAKEKEEAV